MGSNYTAEEMESFLPNDLGLSGSNKSVMILVAELLRTFTDEEHGLTTDEIRDVIKLRMDRQPSENKVLDDIHELAKNKLFGIEIKIPERGETKGFRCTKAFISSSQARLLINMVRACKFITPSQRDELCNALHNMVSYYQQDKIVESVHVDERELPTSQDVFEVAEVAYAAIKNGKKLAFCYAQRDLRGNEFLVSNGNGGNEFEETPIALVYSFGNYYIETWEERRCRRYARRLDKIRNARISRNEAVVDERISHLRDTVQERMAQTFDMWGDDNPRTLFLQVRGRGVGYVYDRFGQGIQFRDINLNQKSGYLCVNVQLGPTFYRWLFGMGDLVRITRPKNEMWTSLFEKDMQDVLKPFDELLRDYEEAAEGLRKQIEKCCAAYGFDSLGGANTNEG